MNLETARARTLTLGSVPRERLGALVSLLIDYGNIIMGRPSSHRIVGCATASVPSNTAGKTFSTTPASNAVLPRERLKARLSAERNRADQFMPPPALSRSCSRHVPRALRCAPP